MKHVHAQCRAKVLTFALVAGCCLSASSGQTRAPVKPAVPDATPALKGPEVKDRNVPGVTPDFGMTTTDGKRRFADRMPAEVFRKALAVLTASDAPAEIRATDTQRETFKTSVEGFEQQVREYRKTHATEITKLRKAVGEMGPRDGKDKPRGKGVKDSGNGTDAMSGPGEAMAELTPAEQKQRDEARAKLRELMEGAPKIETVYTQVWTSLSDPQKQAVDAKLDEYKAEQSKKREDQYVRQRTAKKAPQPVEGQAAKPADAETAKPERPAARPGGGQGRITPERRERLLRVFEQLSPEEQEQLLSRLGERLKDRPSGEKPGEPGKGRRQNKPAPNPDDVKVPSPSERE